jgi:hypothetical protein
MTNSALELVQQELGGDVLGIEFPDPEEPYSYTYKTGKGNLLSFRGRNAAELAGRIVDAESPVLEDGRSLLNVITAIEQGGQAAPGAPFNGGQQQGGYQQQGQQQQGYGQQQSLAPRCAHGEMKYIANGRYGPFYACPTPQGAPDKCKSVNAR